MTVDASLELAYSVAIATILRDPSHAGPVFARARVEEMDPPFRDYAEAINGLRVRKAAIDALSVVDEMTRRGTIGRIGGPAAVMAVGAFIGDVDWAVDVIVRTQRLRRAWRVGEQTAAAAMNPDADPLALARSMQESAQSIIDGIEAEGDVTTPSLREFLDRDDPPFDWVVPGLLERGDRLILTGAEGLGKSVLMRQLAVCAAAGVHPFTPPQGRTGPGAGHRLRERPREAPPCAASARAPGATVRGRPVREHVPRGDPGRPRPHQGRRRDVAQPRRVGDPA